MSFEGRQYSVSFAWVGRDVEVLGTARHVVVRAAGTEVARHPRHTAARLVLEPTHYDGASTADVLAPLPLDTLAQQLTALGVEHAATALPELIETAAREHLEPSAFLGRVLTRQLERKDERRIATMLTLSVLPSGKTLETFDWGFQPKADRRRLDALATCSFVRERQNVVFLGPPGPATYCVTSLCRC